MSGKKTAAKKAGKEEKQLTAVERFRASAHPATGRRATWIMYSPGGKLLRVNVEETLDDENEPSGVRILRGHDVDIPIGEVDSHILKALEDALSWSAEDLGAEVYEPPEPEE
jgi:hypothetical protein